MRSRNTVTAMTWWSYVLEAADHAPQKDIATACGVDAATVSRWKGTDASGKPENVAAFARAYRRPVLEAFVAAGFLTAEDAKQRPAAKPSFDTLSNQELLDLVAARLAAATDDPAPDLRLALARRHGTVSGGEAGSMRDVGEGSQVHDTSHNVDDL